MRLLDTMMKIEKRIERLAERTDVALQPIEIRKRILDDVEALVEPAGRGRRVLPFNWIGIRLAAVDPRRRAALEAVLDDSGGLQRAVESRLAEADCPVPPGLVVDVGFVETTEDEIGVGRPYALLCERRSPAPARPRTAPERSAAPTTSTDEAARPSRARLVVVRGEAVDPVVEVVGERVNIGRFAEVLDRDHRVVRRNQLVFTDVESPVNQTVSRQQAHIRRTSDGEFRIFDDHSTYGTRVFRAGRTLDLASGGPKGLRLEPGDEIYFGQACARFETDLN